MNPLPKSLAFVLRWLLLFACAWIVLEFAGISHDAWINRHFGPTIDKVKDKIGE